MVDRVQLVPSIDDDNDVLVAPLSVVSDLVLIFQHFCDNSLKLQKSYTFLLMRKNFLLHNGLAFRGLFQKK